MRDYEAKENEEIKEGRKIVAIKFTFKKTKILKIPSKKSKSKNFYVKPEQISPSSEPHHKKNSKEKKPKQPLTTEKIDVETIEKTSPKEKRGRIFSALFSKLKK